MSRTKPLILLALAGLSSASHADNCEAIASQIEARMRAGGLLAPQVIALDKASAPGGRVVGNCASGSKQLVLVAGSGAVAAPRLRPVPADNIITECKDGRVVRGPDCGRPPPRPKPAASAEMAAPATSAASAP